MSRYLILLSPILALVTLNLTACMNASSMINEVPTIPTLNDGQGKEPYSVNKHYVLSSVKFLNQQELASDGKTFPTTASGLNPAKRHLIFKNFSAPKSAPKPASVTITSANFKANFVAITLLQPCAILAKGPP